MEIREASRNDKLSFEDSLSFGTQACAPLPWLQSCLLELRPADLYWVHESGDGWSLAASDETNEP